MVTTYGCLQSVAISAGGHNICESNHTNWRPFRGMSAMQHVAAVQWALGHQLAIAGFLGCPGQFECQLRRKLTLSCAVHQIEVDPLLPIRRCPDYSGSVTTTDISQRGNPAFRMLCKRGRLNALPATTGPSDEIIRAVKSRYGSVAANRPYRPTSRLGSEIQEFSCPLLSVKTLSASDAPSELFVSFWVICNVPKAESQIHIKCVFRASWIRCSSPI